jgi:hypothetical protein
VRPGFQSARKPPTAVSVAAEERIQRPAPFRFIALWLL